MLNVLMINLPFSGHVNPTLPLTEKQHTKVFLTHCGMNSVKALQDQLKQGVSWDAIIEKIESMCV